MLRLALVVTTLNSWILSTSDAFFLPVANPQSFEEGDVVELKINKMTSSKTLMPIDYYRLPFCQPEGGPKLDSENLGELLAGDRIESSPYLLRMMEDMYCQKLCMSHLGAAENLNIGANKVAKAIRMNYHNNWIVDNLPAASKVEDDYTVTTRYWQGFSVGFIAEDDHAAYVNNHVNIEIMYYPVEGQEKKYRIVRFMVEPLSIKHEFMPNDHETQDLGDDGIFIKNPIASCDSTIPISERIHTNYEMVTGAGRLRQPASGKVLFTYDVHWEKTYDVHWASRWDVYLSMDGYIPLRVHWVSIANGVIIVFVLSAIVITIMIRNLRQDLARYNQLATDEVKADELEEKGWKLLHADVFRQPCFSPLMLSVCCGTGAQLLCMSFCIIILAALGILSQARRGSFLMGGLLSYALMGATSGYVTARFYKTFNGTDCEKATLYTALGFPGLFLTLFVVVDLMAWSWGSTYAVSFETILILLFLWLGITSPLVFLGAHFGYRQEALEFPVQTSTTPRQIPDQPWFLRAPITLMIAGILPFGACYVELYFVMASVWKEYYYNVFGFLLLVFIVCIVTSAEITILMMYCQLCNEDYNWWWRSFATAGSTSIYMFLYSIVFFQKLEADSFRTRVLFFGYMGLASLGLFLMTGFMGVMASLWFNMKLFGSLKVN